MDDIDSLNPMNPLDTLNAMGVHFTVSSLIAGLIFGIIGFYLFKRGRAVNNRTWIFTGLALMLYSMFTSKPWQDWGIGAALCAWAYYKKDPEE